MQVSEAFSSHRCGGGAAAVVSSSQHPILEVPLERRIVIFEWNGPGPECAILNECRSGLPD